MPLGDRIRELDEQVASAVRRAVEDLREEVRQRLDEATSELQRRLGEVAPDLPASFVSEESLRRIAEEAAAPTEEALEEARAEGRREAERSGRAGTHEALRAALAEIDRAAGQAGVLEALLDATADHAPRAAILLVREGRLAGWGARGFEADGEAARSVALDAGEEPWSALVAGGGAQEVSGAQCAPLVSQLESALPREGWAVPLVLRDRVAAVLYADRPSEDDRADLAALQVLTWAAALALETLAFRERGSTPTLAPVEGAAAAPPAVEEEPIQEESAPAEELEAEKPPPAHEEGDELEAVDVEVEELQGATLEAEPSALEAEPSALEAEPSAIEVEPSAIEKEPPELPEAPEAEPAEIEAAEAEAPGVDAGAPYTPPHGDELLQPAEAGGEPVPETGELDSSALEETAFEEAPELEDREPERAAGFEETPEERSQPIPWQTESSQAVEEGPELEGRPEAGDVPPPPPGPQPAGGQVAPPADVEGPGWAFSATREEVSKDQEAAHEEARRLARLLVSEIQLYNQDAVEEGRRNRDIYERLKDDIDRSRQLYEERVDPEVRDRTDYFYQELVRQLGAGDAKALGI